MSLSSPQATLYAFINRRYFPPNHELENSNCYRFLFFLFFALNPMNCGGNEKEKKNTKKVL